MTTEAFSILLIIEWVVLTITYLLQRDFGDNAITWFRYPPATVLQWNVIGGAGVVASNYWRQWR